MVVWWMFGGVGFHATSKGVELSCELYYTIFSGREYYCVSLFISWEYPRSVDIICISWKYPCSVDIIRILWKYPRPVDIICIL